MRQVITLDPNCPDCKGEGWLDKDEFLCDCVKVQMTEVMKTWHRKFTIYKSKFNGQTYIETL
jgi:hypothetical protein